MTNIIKRFLTSFALISLISLSILNSLFLLFLLIVIAFFALKEFNLIYNLMFNKNYFLIFISNLLSIFYLSIFLLICWINFGSSNIENIVKMVFILSICITTDIGGFIFGKLIGGRKLTKISPNKTYAGMIGSFLLSSIFGYSFYYFQKNIINFEINVLIIIIIVSLTSQLGDLMISLFKRKANLKDTGTILPGHGGILDRIDGILLAIPVGTILISL